MSSDSEDEVMALRDEEDEDEDDDDDDVDMENYSDNQEDDDDDLPNEKAWGKKKKAFYYTDYVDKDYSSVDQKDNADAELEEQEASNLQKRLAQQLDESDFGFDLITEKKNNFDDFYKSEEKIKTDLSKLSDKQKQDFFHQENPEFAPLVSDLKERLDEAKNVLKPFLNIMKKIDCLDDPSVSFVKAKYDILLHYCTNINFYLLLISNKESTASHPVMKRITQYRQLLKEMEKNQGKLLINIKKTLEAHSNGKLDLSKESLKKNKISKSKNTVERFKDSVESEDDSDMLDEENTNHSQDHMDDEKMVENEIGKRSISYQIAKNKGLTPHRKKEQRNPRVKHRNKYRKAKIRRKGAVREVRKETTRYGGELSGIKASVSKSIKIK